MKKIVQPGSGVDDLGGGILEGCGRGAIIIILIFVAMGVAVYFIFFRK